MNQYLLILILLIVRIIFLVYSILSIIGLWRIFEKSNKLGIASIITPLNVFMFFDIIDLSYLWILYYLLGIFLPIIIGSILGISILYILYVILFVLFFSIVADKTAKKFKKSKLFSVGLLLCFPLFIFLISNDKTDDEKSNTEIEVLDVEDNTNKRPRPKEDLKKLLNNKLLICVDIIIISIISIIIILITSNNSYKDSNNYTKKVNNDFRTYFIDKYNINLDDFATNKYNCGYYTLEDDASYLVNICNYNNKIEDNFDKKLYEARKELYDYIISLKHENFATEYLSFAIDTDLMNSNKLEYIIYMSGDKVDDENQKSDYMILQKAKELSKKYDCRSIEEFSIYYVHNPIVKNNNWLNKYNKKILKNRYSSNNMIDLMLYRDIINDDIKYSIHYSLSNSNFYEKNIEDFTYEEFLAKLPENVEIKANDI